MINISEVSEKQRKFKVEIIPRNSAQEEYVEKLSNPDNKVIFATGPAGTGKTMLAVLQAVKDLKCGNASKLVITRPAVGVEGEKHGFLPGDLNQKMEPWTKPVFDVLEEYYSPKQLAFMIEDGAIEISPLAFMRGRSFKDCIIIADEMQNSTEEQMKMLLTRLGEGSRALITGDLRQTDIKKDSNGLGGFVARLESMNSDLIAVVKFRREHIERAAIVSEVLRIYGEE